MDLRKVKKLIELVEESGIAELEVKSGDESVRIAMSRAATGPSAAVVAPQSAPPPAVVHTDDTGATHLNAPMAGTFYRAPSPQAEAFVEVGSQINEGDVICIIESMKMMHEIRAANSGRVVQVKVANGTAVSTGDVLFVLS